MEENKFYITYENGAIAYRMLKKGYPMGSMIWKEKTKPCTLELVSKEMVPLNPNVDASFGYKYTYKIVPDPTKKFTTTRLCMHADELIGEYIQRIRKE